MKRIGLLLFLALTCAPALWGATRYTNVVSGLFSAGATWAGGVAPSGDGDSFYITNNTTVWYDVDPVLANGWAASAIVGTLAYTNGANGGAKVTLPMNGALSGSGDFLIGTSSDPITNLADAMPPLLMTWKSGNITMTKTGGLMWYGATNSFVDYITNTTSVTANNTNLWFASNVSNVASNDVVYVDAQTVQGQGGSVHVVYSVETNRITLCSVITGNAAVVTNTWYGVVMGTTLAAIKTNGAMVCKLSRPVVYLQPAKITSTGAISASNTNTINGVRFTNLGRGALDARNGCTITSCVGNNSNSGGISYQGTGHTINSCVGNNNNGGISHLGTGHTIMSCVGNNNIGGISYLGTGHTIMSCVGNNSFTGISYQGFGHTIISCVGNNNSGAISYQGFGHTITSCVGNNNGYGGIAYYGTGVTITSCVGNNNSYGGISYYGSQTVVNCFSTNTATYGIAYLPTESTFLCDSSVVVGYYLASGNRAPYDVSVINETNWTSDAGLVVLSNLPATMFSSQVFVHTPSATSLTNKPVSHFQNIFVKPSFTQPISLWLFLTNKIGWSYQAVRAGAKPLSPTYISGTTGWTNIILNITNSVAASAQWRLWVTSYSTNDMYSGWSWFTIPTEASSTFIQ